MRNLNLKYFFLLSFLLLSNSAFSGTAHVQLDHQDGELGEPFQLSVTISGSLSGKVELPEIQDLIVSGTGTSTNVSWINGTVTKETSYNFVIEPQKEGTFTIPSLKLKIDDEWVNTDPVSFTVRSGGNIPPPSRGNTQNKSNKNPQMGDAEETDQDQDKNPNVFIEREFSKTDPYEGEPIVVLTKIYHKVQVVNIESNNDKPSGVRVVENKQQENSQERRGNSVYNVITLKQTMIPLRSGKIHIPGFRIRASLIMATERKQRRGGGGAFDDFFDDFFNGARNRVVQRAISSKEADLNVKALPSEGRPANFNDLVGILRIDSELTHTELKAGDTTTLTVTIDGVGALDTMGELTLNLSPNIRIYPDKPQVQEKISERFGLESKRIIRYALVPTQKGDYKLGPLKIPYFDFSTGKFAELSTDLGTLKVAEGDASNASVNTHAVTQSHASPRNDVKALANDLIDIHRNISLDHDGLLTRRDYRFLVFLIGLPGFLCLLVLLVRSFRGYSFARAVSRKKSAYKNFEKRMSSLKDKESSQLTLQESYNAFRTFIGEKFNLNGSALTGRELGEELFKKQIPQEILNEVENLAKTLDLSQYARDEIASAQVKMLMGTIQRLAQEIEKRC